MAARSKRSITMRIILAGYNIDYGIISAFKTGHYNTECLTPETIAAAYARISRDPRPVNELREIAMREVERARQSNRNIVFAMGHSSIAEHAVFNIDALGISRLVVEEIERSRLASYTENLSAMSFSRTILSFPKRSETEDWRLILLLPLRSKTAYIISFTNLCGLSFLRNIRTWPKIQPTVPSSKVGQRKTPATLFLWPQRPSWV
jgi:hypothetical protein